jgi:hypothetical protein
VMRAARVALPSNVVVLIAREITFANDFDGLPLWAGGPHGTDERVRYEADGCGRGFLWWRRCAMFCASAR